MILITIILVLKKCPRNNDYDLIRELRSHIQTLQIEVHFLREEIKKESVLLRSSIITNNNQRNKTSDKTTENPTRILPLKENNSDTK